MQYFIVNMTRFAFGSCIDTCTARCAINAISRATKTKSKIVAYVKVSIVSKEQHKFQLEHDYCGFLYDFSDTLASDQHANMPGVLSSIFYRLFSLLPSSNKHSFACSRIYIAFDVCMCVCVSLCVISSIVWQTILVPVCLFRFWFR